MSAEQIRGALSCGRGGCACTAGGVKTHCPGPSHANGDRNPSLGITEKEGTVLVRCYAGCDQAAVVTALQERDLWPRKEEARSARNGHAPLRIVATYDYRRADGGLAFQVVRLEPKDFRQRRPRPVGGWEWKKGDSSIIYRLPELLAAADDEIVFLVEGEKDADRVASLGLVATTRAEGAGKWTEANSAWLEGRRVAILPDADEAGQQDAARKLTALRSVAVAAVVPLPGQASGEDVSDWLDRGGNRQQLVALAEAALSTAPASDPRGVPAPSLLPFPTEILPSSLRGLIESGSRAIGVPAEFLAVPLLVLAGTAIGNAWEIELKGGWREGPNLYAAIVGDPGAKKTPALKAALRPIHRIQSRLYQDYRAAKAAHDEELALWEKAPRKERGAPPEPPTFAHLWTSDSTTEALAEMFGAAKGLALVRDELVGWVKSMDAYRSGGKGADRQHYLSMWSRSPIKIDRKSRPDPIIVDRPCLSVVGGIQPDVLPELVEHASRDDGFIDRLLFAYPDIGTDRWTDAGIDEAAQDAVDRLFEHLYTLSGVEMPSGDVVPRVARLDLSAREVWQQWYDANAAEHRGDSVPASLKGTWAKLPSQLARLTLILHVSAAADSGRMVPASIGRATLEAAADLVDYFKDHTRATLGELRTPRDQIEVRLLTWLQEHGAASVRTLQRDCLHRAVKTERVQATLEALLEDGRVSTEDRSTGGRPTRIWAFVEEAEGRQDRRRHHG